MIKKKITSILIFFFFATCCLFSQEEAEFKVVVHKENSLSSISKSKLSKIFLKKEKKWENGKTIIPVDQADTSKVTLTFAEMVHKRNIATLKTYWQMLLFSGRSKPPIKKNNDKEVIEFVKNNPNAIGYISSEIEISDVKELKIEK